MIAHSRLAKFQMLDWIKDCIEGGAEMPSDADIVERFGLSGAESARVLLSDLADDGAIVVHWWQPGRPIELGHRKPHSVTTPRVLARTVVKADRDVDAGINRILQIVKGKGPKSQPKVPECKPVPVAPEPVVVAPEPEPVAICPQSAPPPRAVVAPEPEPEPAPPAIKPVAPAPAIERLPTAPGRAGRPSTIAKTKNYQVNCKVDKATYEAATARAQASDISTSLFCGQLVMKALSEPETPMQPLPKPRIPAAVMAAYMADGRGFEDFITILLQFGLSEYQDRRRTAA